MKILVVVHFDIRKLFSNSSRHDIIFVSPENALKTFIQESPQAVLVFAEYKGSSFEKAREALKDIKMSVVNNLKIFRLGFSREERKEKEKYIRLPISLLDDSLDRILQER